MELYRFKYWDALRKRWIEARYRAELHEIAMRYERFEIIGDPWTPPDVGGPASNVGGRSESRHDDL